MYYRVEMSVDPDRRSAALAQFLATQPSLSSDLTIVEVRIVKPDLSYIEVVLAPKDDQELEELLAQWRRYGSISSEPLGADYGSRLPFDADIGIRSLQAAIEKNGRKTG